MRGGAGDGALKPTGPRLTRCLAAMAVLMVLPWAAAGTGSLLVLAGALLVAGMATAPHHGHGDDPGAAAHPGRPAERGA